MLLTVELEGCSNQDCNEATVNICLDSKDMDLLIQALEQLRRATSKDHIHFMSDAWGGGQFYLTENLIDPRNSLIHQLNIHYWPDNPVSANI